MRSRANGAPVELCGCSTVPVKKRLEWSTLLLFVLGLCSLASPHLMRNAHLHHAGSGGSPVSHAGRTSQRSASRSSSRGGLRSDQDRDRLHEEWYGTKRNPLRAAPLAVAVQPAVPQARVETADAVLPSAVEENAFASPVPRRVRGRAPPAV